MSNKLIQLLFSGFLLPNTLAASSKMVLQAHATSIAPDQSAHPYSVFRDLAARMQHAQNTQKPTGRTLKPFLRGAIQTCTRGMLNNEDARGHPTYRYKAIHNLCKT